MQEFDQFGAKKYFCRRVTPGNTHWGQAESLLLCLRIKGLFELALLAGGVAVFYFLQSQRLLIDLVFFLTRQTNGNFYRHFDGQFVE